MHQELRTAWFLYIRLSKEDKTTFKERLGLVEKSELYDSEDLRDHHDSSHPFRLDLGGES